MAINKVPHGLAFFFLTLYTKCNFCSSPSCAQNHHFEMHSWARVWCSVAGMSPQATQAPAGGRSRYYTQCGPDHASFLQAPARTRLTGAQARASDRGPAGPETRTCSASQIGGAAAPGGSAASLAIICSLRAK